MLFPPLLHTAKVLAVESGQVSGQLAGDVGRAISEQELGQLTVFVDPGEVVANLSAMPEEASGAASRTAIEPPW